MDPLEGRSSEINGRWLVFLSAVGVSVVIRTNERVFVALDGWFYSLRRARVATGYVPSRRTRRIASTYLPRVQTSKDMVLVTRRPT